MTENKYQTYKDILRAIYFKDEHKMSKSELENKFENDSKHIKRMLEFNMIKEVDNFYTLPKENIKIENLKTERDIHTDKNMIKCTSQYTNILFPLASIKYKKALIGDELVYFFNKELHLYDRNLTIPLSINYKRVKYIGVVKKIEKDYLFLERFSEDIFSNTFKVKIKGLTRTLKENSKVLFEVIHRKENGKKVDFFAKVLNELDDNDCNLHMNDIICAYDLPMEFDTDVELEVNSLNLDIESDEILNRQELDYRNVLTMTIDPKTAKDFDDALSYRELDNGNVEMGIHIADVSHFVKPNTLVDKEALLRGNSIYLVDRVIPMLPEILSNFACSLRPNEDKYTFSFIFEMNPKNGDVVNYKFGKGLICSDYRLSYEEAQYIIENGGNNIPSTITIDGNVKTISDEASMAIKEMDRLAKVLKSKRVEKGSIILSKKELRFKLSPDFEPISVEEVVMKDANHLIEEFMLLTNKLVGEVVFKNKKPFIYRNHDEPEDLRLSLLQENVFNFGYKTNILKGDVKDKLIELNSEVKDTDNELFINTLITRAMSKANYNNVNIGHFGLSFDSYSHMTSPIRRYSDLMCHRLLETYLKNEKESTTIDDIKEVCKTINEREILAKTCERESIKYMQSLYLSKRKGVYDGMIVSIFKGGISVLLDDNQCVGIISMKDIGKSNIDYETKVLTTKSGISYRLGQRLTVNIKEVNLQNREVYLGLL